MRYWYKNVYGGWVNINTGVVLRPLHLYSGVGEGWTVLVNSGRAHIGNYPTLEECEKALERMMAE